MIIYNFGYSLYGYKAVLQVIALIFSFSIGKIKTQGLNDAKYIIVTVAVYVTSVVTAVTFVSVYSLKTYLNLYATLSSFGLFVGTTVIYTCAGLSSQFKVYNMWHDCSYYKYIHHTNFTIYNLVCMSIHCIYTVHIINFIS